MNVVSELEEREELKKDQNRCLDFARQISKVNNGKKGEFSFMREIKETDRERLGNKMVEFLDRENIDDVEIEYILRKFIKFISE